MKVGSNRKKIKTNRGWSVALPLLLIILLGLIDTGVKSYAQSQTKRRHEIKEEETFKRPEPTRPIRPEVPGVNRYQEDKVFLEYADSLYKQQQKRDTIEKQILKGNVKFRQAGLWMFCDSAYYYPTENSLDAFSNVRMEQGDTLFVYADQLYYEGDQHLAKLKNGPTRAKVTLINKDVTLTTDSLDYDMEIDRGWYTRWGTIDDKVNTLTSLYGEYSPATKLAEFYHDVVLVNNKDGFTMLTDTLYYSTETHIANIESRTEIQSENDTIITNLATYYTDTGDADLLSRSLIIHRDSTGNITTLEGDSIIYDNTTRISRAYMYRSPFKVATPMVITDTAQKTTLIGGFGIYNDSTKEAMATMYPLLMEYSQGDTLFLRADTIKTFLITELIAGKVHRITRSGYPEYNEVPVTMKDSLTGKLWIDTSYFKIRMPFADTPLEMLRKASRFEEEKVLAQIPPLDNPGETLNLISADLIKTDTISSDTIEDERIIIPDSTELEKTIRLEQPDSVQASDLASEFNNMLDSIEASDSIGIEHFEIIDTPAAEEEAEPEKDKEPEYPIVIVDSVPHQFHVALAYHRGRFFKKDIQGVADSMVFVEKDSMLYLFRKPIIWSEERQITGNRIDVHFNDSTTDWAYLPEFGLMSELVDEDFYNQLYGKEINAYFKDNGLRRMTVSGNVETIFLPQEEDSTYNRLVNAESSYMEVFLNKNQLDWLKMWPEVSGTVTPIFLVKRQQMYLQKFKWWGFLRPQRKWYGSKMLWDDNLGEVPDELEQYFLAPSDFGEPKSFTGPRIVLPPTTLLFEEDDEEDETEDSEYSDEEITKAKDDFILTEEEKQETLEDILDSNEEVIMDAKTTEEQSLEIENVVIKEEEDNSHSKDNGNEIILPEFNEPEAMDGKEVTDIE